MIESQTMKILFLEPFFGGSHRDFALGFKAHSCHDVTLVTLPDRFWKWRMRGAALYFVNHIKDFSVFDAIIVTDMLDLTDLLSLAGKDLPPVLMYFHENQLSYPLAPTQRRDFHLGFTNIISAFAADRVLFNSKFHLNDFMESASRLIKQMPDFKPGWMIRQIREKAEVVYPGCQFATGLMNLKKNNIIKPLIIWNHRWEYDKNPEAFFDALDALKEKNISFSLALLGEKYDIFPDIFKQAKEKFKDEILVYGYVESRNEYETWLKKGAIVVSCAIQENFGISIVEAVRSGCIPLLPDRLSYPEIMPGPLHSKVLYQTAQDFLKKLEDMLVNYKDYLPLQKQLSSDMEHFSWETLVKQYDSILEDFLL
jgi:glycosyltransferase involved in cell wall biosynthesis